MLVIDDAMNLIFLRRLGTTTRNKAALFKNTCTTRHKPYSSNGMHCILYLFCVHVACRIGAATAQRCQYPLLLLTLPS